MTGLEIGLASVILVVLLVYIGFYVPVALFAVSFAGVWIATGRIDVAFNLLAQKAAESIESQTFAVIPLFVLMGLLVSASNIGKDIFEVANHYLKRIAGGLGVATIASNTIFAAITGVSIASASIFAKIAVPEMIRHGYSPRFAAGVVAGSSVLGMLIPPSVLLIVFAFLAEESVGRLFLAAIVPGLLLALLYTIYVAGLGLFRPSTFGMRAAMSEPSEISQDDGIDLGSSFSRVAPVLALAFLVIGGIYSGAFTPTEAGAVGAAGALLLVLLKKRMTLKGLWKVSIEVGHITASISLLVIAAGLYSAMLGLTGLPSSLATWIDGSDLTFLALLAIYIFMIIVLGTLLDSISIMLIMVPVFLPIFDIFQADPIWIGILTIIAVEIGLLTPPVGISVYVIKASLQDENISLADIFKGAAPFALLMLLSIVILIAFPSLTRTFF